MRFLSFLLAAGLLYAGTPFRPAIDQGAGGWTAARGSLTVDTSIIHENNRSLRLERGRFPGRLCALGARRSRHRQGV